MEPVTHLAAGLLTAQALRPRLAQSRGLFALCAVAATIPDIDSFAGALGLEAYLRHHRGLTHSVFVLPLLALLLAWTARKFGARLSLAAGFVAAALALASHIFLDVVTAFGTQIFAPFSSYRLSLEGVFVVDPAFTLLLFACVLLARRSAAHSQRFALAGLALLVCYPLLGNALRLGVQHRYEAMLTARGEAFDQVRATPDALAPWYWKVLVDAGPDKRITSVSLDDVSRPYPVTILRRAERAELERLGRSASIFSTFAWFAEHPARQELPAPPGRRETRYVDALFLNTGPVLFALFGHKPVFAELTAIQTEAGELLAWRDEKGQVHPVAPVNRAAAPLPLPGPAEARAAQP